MTDNMKVSVKGDKMTITIDLSKDYGDSKTGKTVQIASTHGNKAVPEHEGMKFGLNVYKMKD